MAAEYTINNNIINLSAIDEDWHFPGPGELYIASIEFFPGAIDDKLIFRMNSATGLKITNMLSTDGGPMIKYFNPAFPFGAKAFDPYIKFSECVLSVGHEVIIDGMLTLA